MRYCVDCPKCDGFILEYERQSDYADLVLFRHSAEQNTDCDGYMQIPVAELVRFGVWHEQDGTLVILG
jgi:hypothetical protein